MNEPTPARTLPGGLRRVLPFAGGVATLAGVACAARNVSWGHVLGLAGHVPLAAIVIATVAALVQALAQATRLWAIFPEGARPSWARVARAHGFGQLTNACVPARAGDVVKVVAMRDERASSATDATGAVLADKALDVVTLGLLSVVLAPALLLGGIAGAMHLGWVAGVAALTLTVGIVVLGRVRPALLAKARCGAMATWRSLRSAATPRRLTIGLVLGGVAWVAEAGSMMALAHPLGVHLSLAHAIGGLLVLNIGIAIPVSVANLGAYEAAMVVGLHTFGATLAQGLAIGVLHHLVELATIGAFALFFWMRNGLASCRLGRTVTAKPLRAA